MAQTNKSLKMAEDKKKSDDEHFLFKRMMEKLLEEKRPAEKETLPAGWQNAGWPPATIAVSPYHQQGANTNLTATYQPPFTQAAPSGSQWPHHQPLPYPVPGAPQYHM